MTILQVIIAIIAFAVAFWLIERYLERGSLAYKIAIIVVVALALLILLGSFGLLPLLNTPITGGGRVGFQR